MVLRKHVITAGSPELDSNCGSFGFMQGVCYKLVSGFNGLNRELGLGWDFKFQLGRAMLPYDL
jgi:hypothetical protein